MPARARHQRPKGRDEFALSPSQAEDVGWWLGSQRRLGKLSLAALADATGLDAATIARSEKGESRLDNAEYRCVARVLGVEQRLLRLGRVFTARPGEDGASSDVATPLDLAERLLSIRDDEAREALVDLVLAVSKPSSRQRSLPSQGWARRAVKGDPSSAHKIGW